MAKIKYKITKEFLIIEYKNNKKSIREIAELLDCSQHVIFNNLKKYNIERNNKLEYHKKHCKCAICKSKRGEAFGKNNGFYGKKHTKKTKEKISKTRNELNIGKGENSGNYKDGRTYQTYYCIDCGVEISYNAKRCLKCGCKNKIKTGIIDNKGKKNGQYKHGGTPLAMVIRGLPEYKEWHEQIFQRDNYTCQECEQYGGKLEAHHINPFANLLSEFLKEYDQFSPIEDKETLVRLAMKWQSFWEVDNGKTLCKDCHKSMRIRIKK